MSNQILWDCHMHSSFSADSDTSMEDMIREAICRGLTGICFTEHLDPDYPPTPDNEIFELDLDGYRETLFRLREKYQKELQIHFGIELGLQPHLNSYFHKLLKTMPFDFVIGSSHIVHGYDPYYKEYFKGREESACYPVFVTEIRPETNEVVLGSNEDVFTTELYADHVNFMSLPDIDGEMELKAKIRYSHSGSMCKVTRTGEDQIHCVFEKPVRAVTPGQAVVLYDGDYVAGGGIII